MPVEPMFLPFDKLNARISLLFLILAMEAIPETSSASTFFLIFSIQVKHDIFLFQRALNLMISGPAILYAPTSILPVLLIFDRA